AVHLALAGLHLLAPEVAGDALADESPLKIGEPDEDRVDVAAAGALFELARAQHSPHLHHVGPRRYSGVTYAAVIPPSTTSAEPVMNNESSDARNSAAFANSDA